MRLVIAEKASVARAIREVVPAGVQVTNCVGHLLEMAEPDAYDARWKNWAPGDLPIRVDHWKLVPKSRTVQQLQTIGRLLKQASEVIHAGDPDREGQLLVDEVLEHFGWRGPTKRMLVTDTHPEGLRKAWANLKDNTDFGPLRHAAECRQRADWLVGMNLTRATTRLLSDGALVSVGRVQTPTLALVVRRHKAIADFTAQTFYTLRANLVLANGKTVELKCEPDPRITVEQQAAALAKGVTGKRTTLQVTTEDKSHRAPLPYKLGDFQKAAEHHFGWSLDKALKSLQSAYEAGWVSYPRSDCRYLPSDHRSGAIGIAERVARELQVPASLLTDLKPQNRVYDSSKVKVHYGIVPTGVTPGASADPDAIKAWKLVSLHYLRTLMPDDQYQETVIVAELATDQAAPYATLSFKARGEARTGALNWDHLDLNSILPPPRQKKKKAEASTPLPVVANSSPATCRDCSRAKGSTTPPKPYTEASLRDDMEQVAKYATDPKMQAILKETQGIGTAATQAAIVKTLIQRGFITVAKNGTLEATSFGIAIIDAIPPQLADPVLTAAWEKALAMIADGNYAPDQFMQRVDVLVGKHLGELWAARARGIRIRTPKPAASKPVKAANAARPSRKTPRKPQNKGKADNCFL